MFVQCGCGLTPLCFFQCRSLSCDACVATDNFLGRVILMGSIRYFRDVKQPNSCNMTM